MTRPNKKQRLAIRARLEQEYGNRCYFTGISGSRCELVIDHIDNNPNNNRPSNHLLVSKSVNHLKNPRGKGKKMHLHSFVCVSEEAAGDQGPRASSLEFLKSLESKLAFRLWLLREMLRRGRVDYIVALDEGAAVADCSQETIKRYIRIEITSERPYLLATNEETQRKELRFKPRFQVMHEKYVERKTLEYQSRNWRERPIRKAKKILEEASVRTSESISKPA